MNPDTIWTKLYEIGLSDKTFLNSVEKENLFYFIDLIYQIEMGGFLYNQSPTNSKDNFYHPYIVSLTYFQKVKLANKLNIYNELYQKSLIEWERSSQEDFKPFLEKNSINELGNRLDELLYELIDDYSEIFEWIEENQSKLVEL